MIRTLTLKSLPVSQSAIPPYPLILAITPFTHSPFTHSLPTPGPVQASAAGDGQAPRSSQAGQEQH